jgi:folate-binding protein YgfZ
VLRGGFLGPAGYTLVSAAGEAEALRDVLAGRGAVPAGAQAVETHRIALGVPRLGVDVRDATLAIEAPFEDRISETKGCYLGQEVVARGTQRGKVNKRLCALRFEGREPEPGAPLLWGAREVGYVTSVAGPPIAPSLFGMGMLRREHWEPGTTLAVGPDDTTVARVAEWPLA